MAETDPVDFAAVLDEWRHELELEESIGHLGLGALEADAWVTLAEAESAAGISRSTLRTWYRSGQIPSRLTPGPHGLQRLVPLTAVVERARRSTRIAPRAPSKETTAMSPDPRSQAAEAVVRLAELATAQAAARAEHAEARAAAVETALRAALERASAAETEVRLLRERFEGR